ncbi:MAG: FtsX-like permease family protein [bacterium]|nr:FtsX-like permease family protein [bacterium]
MKLYRSLKISSNSLRAHKLRTFLALLGISIGVAAVIIMVAIGQGAQQELLQRIESTGTNLLTIKAGQVAALVGRERQFGDVTTLMVKDAGVIASECSLVEEAAPFQDKTLKIKYENIITRTQIPGTTPAYLRIRKRELRVGRFFSQEENKAGLRVAVIGSKVSNDLFKGREAIGEIIRIDKIPFEVIGLLKTKGISAEGGNPDDQIFIPVRTALRRVFNLRHLKIIYVRIKDRAQMAKAEEEIREILRERHRLVRLRKADDFTIHNQVKELELEQDATDAFTLLTAGIAGIALLVGGIGILAIMLLAVKERTNEIGLRRAIGARPGDILNQFLLEALLLGFIGGVIGIKIGILGTLIVGMTTMMTTAISFQTVVVSLIFSLTVGLFFGVYPARKASFLDPIEALRAD